MMWLLTQQGDMVNLDQCHEIRVDVYNDNTPCEVVASSTKLSRVLARGTEAECREMVATIFTSVARDAIAIRLQQGEDA